MADHGAVTTSTGSLRRSARSGASSAGGFGAPFAFIAGVVAAVAALSLAELLAGLIAGAPSPILAVGAAIIARQPPGAKDVVVGLFGTNDKLALVIVVGGVALLFGGVIGLVARSRRRLASGGIALLVLLGFAASWFDPLSSTVLAAVSALGSFVVGDRVLGWLLERTSTAPERPDADAATATDPARRRFLLSAGALGAVAIAGAGLGRLLVDRRARAVEAVSSVIPPASETAPPIPATADLHIDGLTPLVMPNDRFYRIDTSIVPPTVDADDWRLRVTGMVDRETEFTFDQLMQLPLIERYVTIACVSNKVGGDLIGNAKWTGVRLTEVLDIAGVRAGATQIVPRSVDGWTAGFPTEWVTRMERDALIAVKMNDEPLPVVHGYPARLIVPGLYGYVSATKWLSEIQLTTLEAVDAYWVPLGWSKLAPILTQSRIDVPRAGSAVPRSVVPVAGIAWAPERGISKVEVSVDDGPWQAADLATPISAKTWVQWRYDWHADGAGSGGHTLRVRAADGTGTLQDEIPSPPAPDGARGYHTITVTVS